MNRKSVLWSPQSNDFVWNASIIVSLPLPTLGNELSLMNSEMQSLRKIMISILSRYQLVCFFQRFFFLINVPCYPEFKSFESSKSKSNRVPGMHVDSRESIRRLDESGFLSKLSPRTVCPELSSARFTSVLIITAWVICEHCDSQCLPNQ
jgi:hypothetical protein